MGNLRDFGGLNDSIFAGMALACPVNNPRWQAKKYAMMSPSV
jgi:hypothetical protein